MVAICRNFDVSKPRSFNTEACCNFSKNSRRVSCGLSVRHPNLELQALLMSVWLLLCRRHRSHHSSFIRHSSAIHSFSSFVLIIGTYVCTRCNQVRRLTSCDGLLACHAIQGCLVQHVKACAAAAAAVGRDASKIFREEVEDWLRTVIDAIIECLNKGER